MVVANQPSRFRLLLEIWDVSDGYVLVFILYIRIFVTRKNIRKIVYTYTGEEIEVVKYLHKSVSMYFENYPNASVLDYITIRDGQYFFWVGSFSEIPNCPRMS